MTQDDLSRIFDASKANEHAFPVAEGYAARDHGDIHTVSDYLGNIWVRKTDPQGDWQEVLPLAAKKNA